MMTMAKEKNKLVKMEAENRCQIMLHILHSTDCRRLSMHTAAPRCNRRLSPGRDPISGGGRENPRYWHCCVLEGSTILLTDLRAIHCEQNGARSPQSPQNTRAHACVLQAYGDQNRAAAAGCADGKLSPKLVWQSRS